MPAIAHDKLDKPCGPKLVIYSKALWQMHCIKGLLSYCSLATAQAMLDKSLGKNISACSACYKAVMNGTCRECRVAELQVALDEFCAVDSGRRGVAACPTAAASEASAESSVVGLQTRLANPCGTKSPIHL